MSPSKTRPGTILVLYHRPVGRRFADAATVREHIHSFKRYSRFSVTEVNTEYGFIPGLEEAQPGAVLMHYSIFGSGQYRLDDRYLAWLRERPDMLKLAFFQDEFYFCQKRFAFVNDNAIDLVFTHVSPQDIPAVWGRYTPRARAVFNLPGYVDERMVAATRRHARPDEERDIDVGYRGRALPPHMGAGSQEKRVIGEQFKELGAGSGLTLDIDTTEESRIYGDEWYRFLGRCRATLGVESGVSFMDLEDECHEEYLRRRTRGHEPTLEELQAGALGRWDGNIAYRTLGPRHFEAAAFRICQVLYEGAYSGALVPNVHYVPLRKDFSNFDEVLAAIRDPKRRGEMTARAYADLIASGRYRYQGFVAQVDRELLAEGVEPQAVPAAASALRRASRKGLARIKARRGAERPVALAGYGVWKVVAPVSRRVRRVLGLPPRG